MSAWNPYFYTDNASNSCFDVSQLFPYFLMSIIRPHGFFVPFTFASWGYGRVFVSEELLSEVQSPDKNHVCEARDVLWGWWYIGINLDAQEYEWARTCLGLNLESYRVIDLSNSQMQTSTILLTDKSRTSTVHISIVVVSKLEPSEI